MKQLGGMRKADKKLGDDVSLTRFIKLPQRHKTGHKTVPMPANATGTRFKNRVLEPEGPILVSGHSNVKIGRDVRKGRLRGYFIYSLSLEERATCPATCKHWTDCYGNSAPLAKRLRHGPKLLAAIEAEIPKLLGKFNHKGLLIRLHALGDFYSIDYVNFWSLMLFLYPRVTIFGYTAWGPDTLIGNRIAQVKAIYGDRFAVRWSGHGGEWGALDIRSAEDCPPEAFVCPEQTDKVRCCATCALCWTTSRPVAFIDH